MARDSAHRCPQRWLESFNIVFKTATKMAELPEDLSSLA